MSKRRLNWITAVVLLIVLVVLAATALTLRRWQQNRIANKARQTGLIAYEQYRWKQAAQQLGRYIAANGEDTEMLLKYAHAQLNIRPLQRNNLKQALAAYRSILRTKKDHHLAAKKLLRLYLQMNIPAEAELIAERYLQTNDDPTIRTLLAVSLARQRNFANAQIQLKRIIRKHPDHIPAYDTLGRLTENYPDNYTDKPQSWFDLAVRNNPDSALALIKRAAFRNRNKDTSRAVSDLLAAEQLDLSEISTHIKLADQMIAAAMFEKAKSHLTQVETEDAKDQMLWNSWAKLTLKTADTEQMNHIAQAALKNLTCQPWDFMLIAAELFIYAGNHELAEDCLKKLDQKDIAPAAVASLTGSLAEAQGQNYKAIQQWNRAIQLGDKSEKTRLALAKAYSKAGDKSSSVRILRSLIYEQPQLIDPRLDLARLFSQTANWPGAVEQSQLAMQSDPDNIEALMLNIQAKMRLRQADTAQNENLIWKGLDQQLTRLQTKAPDQIVVILLRFQYAMARGDYKQAQIILDILKEKSSATIEVAIAQVDFLLAFNEHDRAISNLYDIIARFPDAVLPVKYLAELLARYRTAEDCEKVLTDAIERIDRPMATRELAMLLSHYYRSWWQQEDKAYQFLLEISARLPNDIPLKRRLLGCRQPTMTIDQAQAIVDQIKNIEGQQGWQWRCAQAEVWLIAQDFQKFYPSIIALLKENLKANPAEQTSRMLLATAYEKAGELQLAVSIYREALGNSPQDVDVIVPAVSAFYKAKEYLQADRILDSAKTRKLNHPQISKLQLQSYLRRGRLDLAEQVFEDIISNEPNNPDIALSLAVLRIRLKKYDQARQMLTSLKDSDPNSIAVSAALVELDIQQGRNADALQICDQMILRLSSTSAYLLRAKTYAKLRETELALKDYQRAATLDPNNVNTWFYKGQFNSDIGRNEQAIDDMQKALELLPENLEVQKTMIELLMASALPDNIKRGGKMLDKAILASPRNTDLQLLKARSLITHIKPPEKEKAQRILQDISEQFFSISILFGVDIHIGQLQ